MNRIATSFFIILTLVLSMFFIPDVHKEVYYSVEMIKVTMMEESQEEDTSLQDNKDIIVKEENTSSEEDNTSKEVESQLSLSEKEEADQVSEQEVESQLSLSEKEEADQVSEQEVEKANIQKEQAKKQYKDVERFDQPYKEVTVPRVNKKVNIVNNKVDGIVDVPQGLAMDDHFIYISSYDGVRDYLHSIGKDHLHIKPQNSVIYVLRHNDKTRKYKVILLPYCGHVGGIACTTGKLWITKDKADSSGNKIVYIDTNILRLRLNWENNDPYIVKEFNGGKKLNGLSAPTFMTSYQDDLYVGTFNPFGNSVIKGYHINGDNPFVSYSIAKKAQGAAFINNNHKTYLMISSSYGRTNSSGIYAYSVSNVGRSNSKIKYESSFVLPGMSEGIVNKDGTFYVLFESASPRYKGAILPIGKVIAGSSRNMVNHKRKLVEKEITVDVNKSSFTYNGSVQKPKIKKVKDKNMNLPYKIKYCTPSSKKPGTYMVKVTIETPTYSGVKYVRYTIKKKSKKKKKNNKKKKHKKSKKKKSKKKHKKKKGKKH